MLGLFTVFSSCICNTKRDACTYHTLLQFTEQISLSSTTLEEGRTVEPLGFECETYQLPSSSEDQWQVD